MDDEADGKIASEHINYHNLNATVNSDGNIEKRGMVKL